MGFVPVGFEAYVRTHLQGDPGSSAACLIITGEAFPSGDYEIADACR
jgi:hypothetical protein